MCARQLPLIDFAARRWRRHAANLPERGIVSRRLSIAVLSLAGIVGLSPRTAPEPFVLDSTGSTYPFVTRLQGTLERRGDSLHISITEGLVASQIPAEIGAGLTKSAVSGDPATAFCGRSSSRIELVATTAYE